MKKRMFIGVVGMLTAYAAVATTALAVFSPRAQVGLAFRTSSYSLKVSADPGSSPPPVSAFSQSISLQGADNMYPGMPPVREKFWLFNDSETLQALSFRSTFSAGDQDWDRLKYAIQLNIRDLQDFSESGDFTAGELQEIPWPLPSVSLFPGEKRQFEVEWKMPVEYAGDPDGSGPLMAGSPVGNEAMGLETTGAAFVITAEPQEEF